MRTNSAIAEHGWAAAAANIYRIDLIIIVVTTVPLWTDLQWTFDLNINVQKALYFGSEWYSSNTMVNMLPCCTNDGDGTSVAS